MFVLLILFFQAPSVALLIFVYFEIYCPILVFTIEVIPRRPNHITMFVQTLAGTRSLISIGVGAGDIAILYRVGGRIGNWLTASTGDVGFLAIMEKDEENVLRRKGVY